MAIDFETESNVEHQVNELKQQLYQYLRSLYEKHDGSYYDRDENETYIERFNRNDFLNELTEIIWKIL